ncbi:unnamed protein product [Somion occarium]|uniref:SPK domain-containing protein n=1 Tax=Somion occarium TaxID=3059160 RepID=A0ABP1CXH3_9APHY
MVYMWALIPLRPRKLRLTTRTRMNMTRFLSEEENEYLLAEERKHQTSQAHEAPGRAASEHPAESLVDEGSCDDISVRTKCSQRTVESNDSHQSDEEMFLAVECPQAILHASAASYSLKELDSIKKLRKATVAVDPTDVIVISSDDEDDEDKSLALALTIKKRNGINPTQSSQPPTKRRKLNSLAEHERRLANIEAAILKKTAADAVQETIVVQCPPCVFGRSRIPSSPVPRVLHAKNTGKPNLPVDVASKSRSVSYCRSTQLPSSESDDSSSESSSDESDNLLALPNTAVRPSRVGKSDAGKPSVLARYPLDKFFSQFPTFRYRPDAPVNDEFNRLRIHEGWKPRSRMSTAMYTKFREALVDEFNDRYGKDENRIESWQLLCTMLRIDPIPTTLWKCREVVRSTHVNLVDLLDVYRTGEDVEIFEDLEGLQDYTMETTKFFPLQTAKAGGVLKSLLRKILS